MSGRIFISYRRDDASAWARLLYDRLFQHFSQNEIFKDVDTIDPGVDFVEAIKEAVGACDVLIAIIGNRWLASSDRGGRRRLDVPEDIVRLEIATALKRGIRVVPVLVDGATMPEVGELPDDLKALVRRNAVEIGHNRFNADSERLVTALERALGKATEQRERLDREQRERAATEIREPQEKEQLDARRREHEEQERLETEQREKARLEAERQGRERAAAKPTAPVAAVTPSPPVIIAPSVEEKARRVLEKATKKVLRLTVLCLGTGYCGILATIAGAPWSFSRRALRTNRRVGPLCGKAEIRLVAFTDTAGGSICTLSARRTNAMRFLMNTLLAPISTAVDSMRSDKLSVDGLGAVLLSSCRLRSLAPAIRGYWRAQLQLSVSCHQFILLLKAAGTANIRIRKRPCRRLHPIAHDTFSIR